MPESVLNHLNAEKKDDVLVLNFATTELHGDQMASELRNDFRSAVESLPANKIVINLEQVTFASSPIFGAFAGFYRDFAKNHPERHIALCGMNEKITEIMSLFRYISTQGSVPLADLKGTFSEKTDAAGGKAKTQPLFKIIAPDVPSAIAALNAI